MIFKNYQNKILKSQKEFFETAGKIKSSVDQLPEDLRDTFNWVQSSFAKAGLAQIPDNPKNGLGEDYPRFCIKVPTGGGKTLLAVETIRQYQELFAKRKTGLTVWIVPSEVIYTQTLENLRNKAHPYRQLLDQASGGNTVIVEKGQELRAEDVEGNLVVLFLMIQSVSRANNKESLKVFSDNGSYDTFFPDDNRFDQHKELLEKVPNLDTFAGDALTQVKTSLGNVVRLTNPLIIIDEIHKVFTPTAKNTINNLNPSVVVGFTATPKQDMNILVSVSGQELKEEEMIKLDLNIKAPTRNMDWQTMLKEVQDLREGLEKTAKEYESNTGLYIRPISLIQVDRTGKEQRGKKNRYGDLLVHSEDAREYLVSLGIPEDEIAVKSSSTNDIENVDLLSRDCQIRYIITKTALQEGWDCPFAYVLGIIPNVNSNTGVTQLVGRILRQPFARKTKIQKLDESYVFYTKGETQKILNQIKKGFKDEGLGDLVKSNLNTEIDDFNRPLKKVSVKEEIRSNYPDSLYLPQWLIKVDETKYRAFNYDIDIKPQLDEIEIDFKSIIETVKPALSKQEFSRTLIRVDLGEDDLTEETQSERFINTKTFDLTYFARRLSGIFANPFKAREIAEKFYKLFKNEIVQEELETHSSFIVAEVVRLLQEKKEGREKNLFEELISNKQVILAISEERYGFKFPENDFIKEPPHKDLYKYYLYDDFDYTSLTGLEQSVAGLLEKEENVIWWVRNEATKGWYAIQGYKKYKVRPDFIVARKNNDEIDLIYGVESKGKMLSGNEDTLYKSNLFDLMNRQTVETINEQGLLKVKPCDKFYFELVEQDSYENQIRTTLNKT